LLPKSLIYNMNYIIIENEYFALESLKSIVEQLRPDYKLLFTAESVEDSVDYLKQNKQANLIFMDIELVDGNCFEIFRQVEIDIPIIFTTAYDEFAIQAFKVNSVGYVLKPVSESAIVEVLDKFERYHTDTPSANIDYKALEPLIAPKSSKKRLLANVGDNYIHVDMDDVTCFLSEDKYIFVITQSGKRLVTSYTNLGQVEAEIDPEQFFQVSRSIIVNINAIARVAKYFNGRLKVILKGNNDAGDIIVSAAKRDQFLKWMGGSV